MLINAGASLGVVDQPWRLLSSCFLHLAWWHLLLNMLGLMLFGYLCEGKLGRLRYTILYFFCCLGGSLASAAAFGGTTSAAGASGAIMGLAGFLTALTYFRGDLYRSVVVKQILISASDIAIIALLYGFVFNDFMSGSMTDNAGHTGGFVAGMLAAFILPRAINKRQLAGRFIAASLSILLAAGLWTIAQSKYFEDGGHGARAILAMARGDNACARAEFDQALAAEKSLELAPTDQIQGAKATPAVMQAAFKNALGSLLGFDRRRKLSELYNSASWGKSTVGDYSEAIALADRSLSYSEDPAALDTRAVACMGAKRYPQARRDLQRALVLRPGYGASAFHLAQLNLLDRPQKQTSQGRLKSEQHQRFDYDPETWEYQFGKP
jgi:membrane associated rhomboid family serine protease